MPCPKPHSLYNFFLVIVKNISVEPIVFLYALSLCIFATVQQLGIYRVICDKMFNTNNHPLINDNNNNFTNHFDCWNTKENLRPDPSINGSQFWWPNAQNQIQQETASFFMYLSLSYTFSCAISDVFWGAYGDRYGRKFVLVFGLLGVTAAMFPIMLLLMWPLSVPLYLPYIMDAMVGFTGYFSNIIVSASAYVADTMPQEKSLAWLTERMTIIQICQTLPRIVAPMLVSGLFTVLTYGQTMLVAIILSLSAAIMAGVLLKQIKPKTNRFDIRRKVLEAKFGEAKNQNAENCDNSLQEPVSIVGEFKTDRDADLISKSDVHSTKDLDNDGDLGKINPILLVAELNNKQDTSHFDSIQLEDALEKKLALEEAKFGNGVSSKIEPENQQNFCQRLKTSCLECPRLFVEVWHNFVKRRPGRQRAYLFLITLAFFINMASSGLTHGPVATLYVQKAPLNWNQDTVNTYRSTMELMQFFGALIGIFLLKKFLKFSDTTVAAIALASIAGQLALYTISRQTYVMFLAATVSALSGLAVPCLQSFVAKLIPSDEVGKTFAAFSLSANFASLLNQVAFGGIYRATVASMPYFVFLFACLLLVIVLFAVIFVQVDYYQIKPKWMMKIMRRRVYPIQE